WPPCGGWRTGSTPRSARLPAVAAQSRWCLSSPQERRTMRNEDDHVMRAIGGLSCLGAVAGDREITSEGFLGLWLGWMGALQGALQDHYHWTLDQVQDEIVVLLKTTEECMPEGYAMLMTRLGRCPVEGSMITQAKTLGLKAERNKGLWYFRGGDGKVKHAGGLAD